MKILYLLLFCVITFGCTNRTKVNGTLTNTSTSKETGMKTNVSPVAGNQTDEQAIGMEIIDKLSERYADNPNVKGDFLNSSKCPKFLEGIYFDGPTLVLQVTGDTLQARRKLEKVTGSSAFRLEQIKGAVYSQKQLTAIVDELNKIIIPLKDEEIKGNLQSWGSGLRHVEIRLIFNTPEYRKLFRERIMDSPALEFSGPEKPVPNGRVGVNDTLGISLRPEYSVYSTSAPTATFILYNNGEQEIMCGAHYTITYLDEKGIWRELPTNTFANDIGFRVCPGENHHFDAHLYPHIHPNKPGRYRFFYNVYLLSGGNDFTMMTEFRLTDNAEELKKAVKPLASQRPKSNNTSSHYSPLKIEDTENKIYDLVETMPEFPGGSQAMFAFIEKNLRYPQSALKDSVQGRVIVQVIINRDGSVTEPNVLRSIDARLDREALRIMEIMPKWKPGLQQGKPVRVKYAIPITFRLPTK